MCRVTCWSVGALTGEHHAQSESIFPSFLLKLHFAHLVWKQTNPGGFISVLYLLWLTLSDFWGIDIKRAMLFLAVLDALKWKIIMLQNISFFFSFCSRISLGFLASAQNWYRWSYLCNISLDYVLLCFKTIFWGNNIKSNPLSREIWFVLLFSHSHSGRSVWTGTTYGRTNVVMHGLAMVSTWCVWKYGTLFMDSYSIFYVACIGLRDHLTHVRLNSFLLANGWLTARSTSEHGWENTACNFLFYSIVSF